LNTTILFKKSDMFKRMWCTLWGTYFNKMTLNESVIVYYGDR